MLKNHREPMASHRPSPPTRDSGTAWHGGVDSSGTTSLKELALKRLTRDSARDNVGTEASHRRPSSIPPVRNHKTRPSKAKLNQTCYRAVAEYPSVDPDQLWRFLEVADDPTWCSERVAKHIARRMSEGLLPYPIRQSDCEN